MLNLELVISCKPAPEAVQAAQIRAWVDPQPERGLESEFELSLERVSQHIRRVAIELAHPSSYLFYRVGLAADPSAVWQLLIREAKSGRVLHEDSDLLALPKVYLFGSCRLSQRVATRRTRLHAVSEVRAPELDGRARLLRAHAVAP